MPRPIVALLTDFGLRDSYVAQMKGVILGVVPDAQLVDVSHEVPPGDVLAGAWLLATAWRAFPPRTVFLGVVDPGVGTSRRSIALEADSRFGVGPDNGLFTLVLDPPARAVELTRRELAREPVSSVFHGRDVFAPVAAALARGASLDEVGAPLAAPQRLPLATPSRRADGSIAGHVIHIDRFGNLVSDIRAELLPGAFRVRVAGHGVAKVVRAYAEAEDELVALVNSAGHLEVALFGRSAAAALGVARGAAVEVVPR